jgi:hypothetical protein
VVGHDFARDAVYVAKGVGWWRYPVDPTPDHQEDLGADIVGLM